MANRVLSDRTIRRHAVKRTLDMMKSVEESYETETDSLNPHLHYNSNDVVTRNASPEESESVESCCSSQNIDHDNFAQTCASDNFHQVSESELSGEDILENFEADAYASDSNESDEDDSQNSFKDDLRQWVLESGIAGCHSNSLLKLLKPHFPELPNDIRTLLATPTSYDVKDISGGKYFHFGIKEHFRRLAERIPELLFLTDISIQINIDGLPLFKSSNDQFWPILGIVEDISENEPFIIGLWVGTSKPKNANEFLQYFITEMKDIQCNGVTLSDKIINVNISSVICDTPARAFVKMVKGHSGYYGCDKCTQSGMYLNHRMTFPECNAPLRTDAMFNEMTDEDHHKDHSSLRELDLGLVTQFPLDYMHLVCLGVVKRMLLLWINGPLATRLMGRTVQIISDNIVKLRYFLPTEFVRKGRPLSEIDRWKATEFRTFILYIGPVVLKDKLQDSVYNHFIMLHVAITILCSQDLCSEYCNYAEKLLVLFVQHFAQLYGSHLLVYNVHALIHMPNDVQKFGNLQKFSSFPFENYLQTIKRLIRKPNYPLEQVIRRIQEKSSLKKQNKHAPVYCKREHIRGPLPPTFPPCNQYEELHLQTLLITIKKPNNCLLVNGSYYIVRNIVICNNIRKVVCQGFRVKKPFFKYPLDSEKINIAFLKEIKEDLITFNINEISCKVVLLKHSDGFVAFPLIHTT